MRVRPAPASPLYPKLGFARTDHPITVWASAMLLRLYVELLSIRTTLITMLTPSAKTSNHQIPVVDRLLARRNGLVLNAERFEHRVSYLEEVLHHGETGAGQIAKVKVWRHEDRGSARIVPFLRSPTRTVERVLSLHRARTGDPEVHLQFSNLCRHGCVARDR